jgi:2-polyprenyl-3-methyl-5-hydroxy-6-metoxy-1,4-benzoquinol methylase
MTTTAPGDTSGLSPRAREVARRFERFREPGNGAFFAALAEHFVPLDTHDCLPMYFEYAATTNARGRAAAERIARDVPLGHAPGLFRRRRRMLDLGCAYGGFLVAFAERGFRVTGIEINEALLRLAAVNLRENGVDADLVRGDATLPHPAFRNRFDFIAANDVVEHVARLDSFLGNLRDWLTPGGVAYLQIPNGAHPPFVAKDGHHQLFGITLLEFAPASAYYNAVYAAKSGYDTYHYEDLASYRRIFATSRLSLDVLPAASLQGASVDGVLRQLAELESGLDAGLATVPGSLRPLVEERVRTYLERVKAAPRSTAAERETFLLEYGPSFWMALARRER